MGVLIQLHTCIVYQEHGLVGGIQIAQYHPVFLICVRCFLLSHCRFLSETPLSIVLCFRILLSKNTHHFYLRSHSAFVLLLCIYNSRFLPEITIRTHYLRRAAPVAWCVGWAYGKILILCIFGIQYRKLFVIGLCFWCFIIHLLILI